MLRLMDLRDELCFTMVALAGQKPMKIENEIINSVCRALKVDYIELTTGNRSDDNSEARYIIFQLLKEHTKLKYKGIGTLFNRDFSTVMHGVKRFKELYQSRDKRFLNKIKKVSVELPGIEFLCLS